MGTWPSREQREQMAKCENVILYKSDFKLEWMQDPWDDVEKSRKWINSIYHTIQPDLIHFNNYANIDDDWTCPVVTVFHSCVTTWWQAVKGTALPSSWDAYSRIVKNALNKSDVVVSPTKAIIEKAQDLYKITAPTRVIYNGKEMEFEEEIKKDIHNKFFRYEDALLDATEKNLEDIAEITKIAFEPYESILKKRGQYELQKKQLHLSFLESYSLIKDTLPSIAERHQV
jgi:hypothetical protein